MKLMLVKTKLELHRAMFAVLGQLYKSWLCHETVECLRTFDFALNGGACIIRPVFLGSGKKDWRLICIYKWANVYISHEKLMIMMHPPFDLMAWKKLRELCYIHLKIFMFILNYLWHKIPSAEVYSNMIELYSNGILQLYPAQGV